MNALATITHPVDYAELVLRLALDVAAMIAFALVSGLRRRARHELLVVLACFNLGLFVVLTVITVSSSATAIGFGLFAMLSIIRLRSEPFTSTELGLFFAALVLALVNGTLSGNLSLVLILDAIVLVPVLAAGHPRMGRAPQRRQITLDCVHTDDAALRADVEHRLGVRVVDLNVVEIDYVREVTVLTIRFVDTGARRAPLPAAA
jgi:hypothetical protein